MRYIYILSLIVILVACSQPAEMPARVTAIPVEAIPTIDPDQTELARGQYLYNFNCAHCHGYAGEGQHPNTVERSTNLGYHVVPAHDSSGHTWHHPDQLIFEIIKYGAESPLYQYTMTPFGERITDDEIYYIIDYMRLWWTDDQRAWQAQLTEQFTENNPYWTETRGDEEAFGNE